MTPTPSLPALTASLMSVNGADVQKEPTLFADKLSFPTGLAFDDTGALYVAEAGLPFAGAKAGGRIWRLDEKGSRELLLEGLRHPVTGLTWHAGWFYISEGGRGARISRWKPGADPEELITGFPGPGNYHLNMTVMGSDGLLYFSHGAMTNTGIIGLDAYELGWLRRLPHAHDLPGYDITLAGVNIETSDPVQGNGARACTGAFVPFGAKTERGQRIKRQLPCTASLMRCKLDGSSLELVAWGLRNAYGLCFLPDGRLLATDQGADDRGSRPVGEVPDLLFEVKQDCWYGWPDFIGGIPITDARFTPTRGGAPAFVLANHDELPLPEKPLLEFPIHSCATKLAVIPEKAARFSGHIVVALFGDERPMTAPPGPRAGRSLARIDPSTWTLHPFFDTPLRRPIDVAFHPRDGALFVLDFGAFEMEAERGIAAEPYSGCVHRLPLNCL